MDKKERMDLILSKIPKAEDKKSFLEEFRSNKTRENMKELLKKYGVVLSEEEINKLHESVPQKLSAEDLKNAAGGDRCDCWGGGICSCVCCYWY